MPRSMHLHKEIYRYPNLKSISELFKMYMKILDSFILASRNERKSEQAHIPHAPTLLEKAVYNEW